MIMDRHPSNRPSEDLTERPAPKSGTHPENEYAPGRRRSAPGSELRSAKFATPIYTHATHA